MKCLLLSFKAVLISETMYSSKEVQGREGWVCPRNSPRASSLRRQHNSPDLVGTTLVIQATTGFKQPCPSVFTGNMFSMTALHTIHPTATNPDGAKFPRIAAPLVSSGVGRGSRRPLGRQTRDLGPHTLLWTSIRQAATPRGRRVAQRLC